MSSINKKDIQNQIKEKVLEYISLLNDEKDIYNTDCFNGLLGYIGDTLFIDNQSLDSKDIKTLNKLFKIYRNYCGLYKQKIYITGFCLFCNIPFDSISRIIRGLAIVPLDDYKTVIGWVKSSEHSQLTSDSKKSEFLLERIYGYTEGTVQNEPQQSNQTAQLPTADTLLLPEQK